MKHHFKKLPVFLYICLALIAYSCSEEKDVVKEQSRISTVNLKDLPFLQKELTKDKRKGSCSKEDAVYYLDKINTQNIIQIIDKLGIKSYTFALNYREQDTLFNLCAKETNDGYSYTLLKYTTPILDQWIQDIKTTKRSDIIPEVKVEPLDNKIYYIANGVCISITFECGSDSHHTLSEIGNCHVDLSLWILTIEIGPCAANTGGGNSGSNDSGETGDPDSNNSPPPTGSNTGSGSNNSSSTTTTAPNVSDDGGNETGETPCERISRRTNETEFKNKFNSLRNDTHYQMDSETGFSESRDANGNTTYSPLTAVPNGHAIDIPLSFNATSYMHDHTNFGGVDNEGNQLISIKNFSPKDIQSLMGACQTNATNLNVPLNDIYSVVLSSEGIFAMNLLSPPVSNTLTYADWKLFRDEYAKDCKEFFDNGVLNNTHVKKKLLQLLKKFHLDDKVALFEANFTASDPTTPKWNRLTLNPLNSNIVVPTPCK